MKAFQVALFCTLAVFAVCDQPEVDETGWYVPNIDGTFSWFDKEIVEQRLEALKDSRANDAVRFFLYTKSNPEKPTEIMPTKLSVSSSPFNPKNPVKFTIHGWTRDYTDNVTTLVRRAWFKHGDYNIIGVDWERARSDDYFYSVSAIPDTGKKVAAMVDFLHQNFAIPLAQFEVIGHSLGAHVSGFTGKNVKSGKVQKIVGLDPAYPLFSYNKPQERISSTDALYVESIQTNAGKQGFLEPIGKSAFYPNGGKDQPGCGIDFIGGCAHSRAVIYYAEAIEKNNFPAMKCTSYKDAINKNCGSTYSSVRMAGKNNAVNVEGHFYVPVKSSPPFGMGA